MFDFSLTEMMLAGVVALVVLGPERLPVVARKAGQWMGKIQSLAAGVRSELAAHAEVAELIKVKQELEETSAEIQQDLQNLSKQVEQNSQEIAEHLHDSVPAWERLPEQKTPADFGLEDNAAAYNAPAPALSSAITPTRSIGTAHTPTLRKRALSRKRDMRPRHRPTPKLRSRR